jgi:hypothetical protein
LCFVRRELGLVDRQRHRGHAAFGRSHGLVDRHVHEHLRARGTFQADLQDSAGTVSGSIRLGSGCLPGGKLDGTVSGDSFNGRFVAGAATATMTGTVSSSTQVDGTYTLPAAGACPDDSGSFELLRH